MFDSIIDFLADLFGKAAEKTSDIDIDGVDVDPCDTDYASGGESDGSEVSNLDGADVTGAVVDSGSQVISGNREVDDLLTKGIDTSDANTTHDTEDHSKISFTSATKCNLCSCGHYVGRDGVDDICICGHAKWQHYWQ